ncbi:hypothetical protein HCN44_001116 [Aphidius gifuensis]|uniref:Glucose-methanol-choline oxidoreductase N-terminal domain-containing protein n=1 Tax=Aphidius gifuensis TaxID=684658 RepID=A0A834XJU3_APHGI|nr:glucose dehydrogenase [FAD, quinone]-like [Aphidius gifuensis]KAF7988543.1 hypothetical protein HCN44_001116 [Aphidius gifuensis]
MDLFIKTCSFIIFSIIILLLTKFIELSNLINGFIDWSLNDINELKIYDYIIVGAGSAGSILSSKLSNGGFKVLLIEAGGPPPAFADIPALLPIFQKSSYDWKYKTVSQNHSCKALINNQSSWPRGKILGGSSRLNNMVYMEGHPQDYHGWFPDYKNHLIDDKYIEKNLIHCTELCHAVYNALSDMKINEINNTNLDYFEKVKFTMINGSRWSTDKLLNDKYNMKLDIMMHSHVEKIIFNLKTNKPKADGVLVMKWGKKLKIMSKYGVILSAGTIGTPKLLMLSGIGPADDLEKLNINVIKNLPVGKNLIDHILTGLDLITITSNLSFGITELLKPLSAIKYFIFGKGPWTSSGMEISAMLKINSSASFDQRPDIQLMVLPSGISQDNGIYFKKIIGLSDKVFDKYYSELTHKTAVTIAPVLLHPKSSGFVKLKSSNPLDDPIIDPNYLSHKDDVTTLISGIKFIEKLVETKSMKLIGAKMNKKKFPGCERFIYGDDNYWECYIRHMTLTSYHPVGTCGIGSVVDDNFRVYGTDNLYVIDASVLPILPSGNINAAVMMLANKASSILLGYTKSKCHINDFINYIFFI